MESQISDIVSVQTMSSTIGALAAALAKAQGGMGSASKSSKNPFFNSKYADLAQVWEVLRGPLSKNDLAVIQTTSQSDGAIVHVITTLVHKSGEWIRGTLSLRPNKISPQDIGSALTYGRRYGLAAICGVVQEDDDGNAASGKDHNTPQAPQSKAPIAPSAPVTPTVKKTPGAKPPTGTVKDRATTGLTQMGFNTEETTCIMQAYKGKEQNLYDELLDIYKKIPSDREKAKNDLLKFAEDILREEI